MRYPILQHIAQCLCNSPPPPGKQARISFERLSLKLSRDVKSIAAGSTSRGQPSGGSEAAIKSKICFCCSNLLERVLPGFGGSSDRSERKGPPFEMTPSSLPDCFGLCRWLRKSQSKRVMVAYWIRLHVHPFPRMGVGEEGEESLCFSKSVLSGVLPSAHLTGYVGEGGFPKDTRGSEGCTHCLCNSDPGLRIPMWCNVVRLLVQWPHV